MGIDLELQNCNVGLHFSDAYGVEFKGKTDSGFLGWTNQLRMRKKMDCPGSEEIFMFMRALVKARLSTDN